MNNWDMICELVLAFLIILADSVSLSVPTPVPLFQSVADFSVYVFLLFPLTCFDLTSLYSNLVLSSTQWCRA